MKKWIKKILQKAIELLIAGIIQVFVALAIAIKSRKSLFRAW